MTREVRSVRVGAEGGHISRNFLSDENDHVYVPRLQQLGSDPNRMGTTLVETDGRLKELAETPIRHYTMTRQDDSHGIIGILYLVDHSLVFATDRGFLSGSSRRDGPAGVVSLGFFHPDGRPTWVRCSPTTGERARRRFTVQEESLGVRLACLDLRKTTSTSSAVDLPSVDGRIRWEQCSTDQSPETTPDGSTSEEPTRTRIDRVRS